MALGNDPEELHKCVIFRFFISTVSQQNDEESKHCYHFLLSLQILCIFYQIYLHQLFGWLVSIARIEKNTHTKSERTCSKKGKLIRPCLD